MKKRKDFAEQNLRAAAIILGNPDRYRAAIYGARRAGPDLLCALLSPPIRSEWGFRKLTIGKFDKRQVSGITVFRPPSLVKPGFGFGTAPNSSGVPAYIGTPRRRLQYFGGDLVYTGE